MDSRMTRTALPSREAKKEDCCLWLAWNVLVDGYVSLLEGEQPDLRRMKIS